MSIWIRCDMNPSHWGGQGTKGKPSRLGRREAAGRGSRDKERARERDVEGTAFQNEIEDSQTVAYALRRARGPDGGNGHGPPRGRLGGRAGRQLGVLRTGSALVSGNPHRRARR